MRTLPKPRTLILCAVCLGVILYVGLRVAAESSDGYRFLDQAIRRAPAVQAQLGQIEAVKLSYLGRLQLKASGPDRRVTLTLNVTGEKAKATVVASAERTGGVWSVTASSMDGKPVLLN